MEWLSVVLSGLIGVGGSLGGVALTQRATAKQSERDRSLAVEAERGAHLRHAALLVTKLFSKEMDETGRIRIDRDDPDIRGQMEKVDALLEERFHGPETSELKLAISLIPDRIARDRLGRVLRAYHQSLSVEGGLAGVHSSIIVGPILRAGYEVSAAYARGEEPGADELKRYERFTQWPGGRVSTPQPDA